MAVTFTDDELDLFNKNGISDDDIQATVNNYRSQGLDDNAIRQKVDVKLEALKGAVVTPELKGAEGETVTEPSVDYQLEKGQVKKRGWFHPVDFAKSVGKGVVHGLGSIGMGLGKQFANPIREKLGKRPLTEAEIQNEYGKWLGLPEQGGAYKTGEFAGELAPYFLLPETNVAGLGTWGNRALTFGYQGGLSGELNSLAEKGFNPKENLKDAAIGAGGAIALGSAVAKGADKIARLHRAKNVMKRRNTPLAERMTPEQLERATTPASQYGVADIDSNLNKQIAEQIQNNVNAEQDLMNEYRQVHSDMVKKYGSIENLKKQAVEDFKRTSQTGEISEARNDYLNLLTYEQTLGEAKYINNNIKPSATRESNYTKQPKEKVTEPEPVIEPQPETVIDNVADDIPPVTEDVTPKTTIEGTGELKNRGLAESVVNAEGTPKEVRQAIKNDMPQYRVLHNNELTEQAVKEVEADFNNELSRLSTSKDFDALDFEKARQVSKRLFAEKRFDEALNLMDNVDENATKKGQAIQALSLWSNMTPEGAVAKANKLIKEANKKLPDKKKINLSQEDIENIKKLQETAINATDDLERTQGFARTAKYISELVPSGIGKKLKTYRNISLLLNPKTLGRNIIGNALFNTVDTGSKALAAGIDRIIGLGTKQKTRVAPQLKELFSGGLQGAKTGFQEALEGIDTRGLGQRFDLGTGRVFRGGNTDRTRIIDVLNAKNKLGTAKEYFQDLLPKSRIGQAIKGDIGALKKIPSDFMNSLETGLDIGLRVPDRAQYEATFAESVANMMKAQGLKEPTQEILEQAEQEALESVFQNNSLLSDMTLKLREGLNKLGTENFGLGDLAIPYAQTPANLAQQAINYSPLGAIKGIKNLIGGNQRQASLDLARALMGSGIITGGVGLAKSGIMTPTQFEDSYIKNRNVKNNLRLLGIMPESIGGVWYSPFQPVSSSLAVGSAIANGENPLQAGLNTMLDLPFLQNVAKGLADIKDKGLYSAAENFASSTPSQFAPTLLGQVAQYFDNVQRETYDKNKLMQGLKQAGAKIPIVSKMLPEKVNVKGEPIERYNSEGIKRMFDVFVNPTFINKPINDTTMQELKVLYDQTGSTKQFLPTVDKKIKFKQNGENKTIELTGEQVSEYQRVLGKELYQNYTDLMNTQEYANSDDETRIKMLEKEKKRTKKYVDSQLFDELKNSYVE